MYSTWNRAIWRFRPFWLFRQFGLFEVFGPISGLFGQEYQIFVIYFGAYGAEKLFSLVWRGLQSWCWLWMALLEVLSDRTAACFRKYFPRDPRIEALAAFIDCVSKCRRILTSRCYITKQSDKWADALRIHYDVINHSFHVWYFMRVPKYLLALFFSLGKQVTKNQWQNNKCHPNIFLLFLFIKR